VKGRDYLSGQGVLQELQSSDRILPPHGGSTGGILSCVGEVGVGDF